MVSGGCEEFDKGGLTRELFDVSSSFGRGVVNLSSCGSFCSEEGKLFGQEILFVVARLFILIWILLRLLKNEVCGIRIQEWSFYH